MNATRSAVYEQKAVYEYNKVLRDIVQVAFPSLTIKDIDEAIRYSISKRYKEEKCTINNNYTHKKVEITLLELTNYVLEKEPIITAWGVMWKKKGTVPNPLLHMIKGFMDNRGILKNKMFQYPKGSADYEKYMLLQLLAKLDANALYGVLGQYSCMYYNIHVAATVTTQGRSLVSTLGMFFEQFLANNVKFGSLNEIVTFIHNIISERPKRHWKDSNVLDRNITLEEAYVKVMMTCGFEWIPTEDDCQAVWDIMSNLAQDDLNRIYYKNNLYEFITKNSKVLNMIIVMLRKLETPFYDPNKCPEEISVELDVFCDIMTEYLFYNYHIIDRIDRMDNMIKCVTAISDTDSTIASYDAWYNCILNYVKDDKEIKINKYAVDAITYVKEDKIELVTPIEPYLDYDFYDERTIETTRALNLTTIIPQDNLRYSIINILAYCTDKMINKYMKSYCTLSNSYRENDETNIDGCLIIAKNEFLFKRVLLTDSKKNYATLQEIQEGNMVPEEEQLDQKGLAIMKSSLNKNTRNRLENILYEDILHTDKLDRVRVLKQLAILEEEIYKSLQSGSKDYYKPVTIKSLSSYDDPTRIQGIKAAIAWNELCGDIEMIDLRERNAIDIVKVNITIEEAEKIRYTYPEAYARIEKLIGDNVNNPYFKGIIKSLGVPKDSVTPEWIKEFINYTAIINDNLKNFPLKSIGIMRQGKDSINYTNIIKL